MTSRIGAATDDEVYRANGITLPGLVFSAAIAPSAAIALAWSSSNRCT